jgi:acetylglutamate kinase
MEQKLVIVKIGGNVIDKPIELDAFMDDFAILSTQTPVILVHGGGKIASAIGEKMGIVPQYHKGRRLTDDETIDLVTMVYGGLVNKKIVAKLQSLKCNAIGFSGADGNLITATKRPVKEIDYGWAGDLDASAVDAQKVKLFLDNGFVPVFAPLTHDGEGHILNTNADTIAASLAISLSAFFPTRLVYCFEKKGVLENVDDEQSVIETMNKAKYAQLLADNKLFEGILPKLENCFSVIDAGVHEVLIGHAHDLLQNTTANTVGTLITR